MIRRFKLFAAAGDIASPQVHESEVEELEIAPDETDESIQERLRNLAIEHMWEKVAPDIWWKEVGVDGELEDET